MDKVICIVTAGDPGNNNFDYSRVYENLRRMFREQGAVVILAKNAEEGIKKLNEDSQTRYKEKLPSATKHLMYISAYYCEEAIALAKIHSPRIRFVVYSVGSAPIDIPIFAFRGMLNHDTFSAIFG